MPSQDERRSSYPNSKVEMRRHRGELNFESPRLGDRGGSTTGTGLPSRTDQMRSASTNALPNSMDEPNHLPLSSIRALSVPITPGSVKSKRDWITRNSPDSSSSQSNRPRSPNNDTTTAPGQVLRDWTLIPPFNAHGEAPPMGDNDIRYDNVDEVATPRALVEQPPTTKGKTLTRDKWPPQPKTRSGSNSQSAKHVAKIQVSHKVKLLRSNFEKFEGSHRNGTPGAFRVAQEMYETLALPKSVHHDNKGNATRTTTGQSQLHVDCLPRSVHNAVPVSSKQGQAKHNDLLHNALEAATDLSLVADKVPPPPSMQSVSLSNGTLSQDQTSHDPNMKEPSTTNARHSIVNTSDDTAPIHNTLPPQGHFANFVLPSGQKLPPPKGRKNRRTNYRIRYAGPTSLRLQDVYGHLYEIPEVDDRFIVEPKDSMVAMPQRKGESPYLNDTRKRPDIASAVAGDVAPKRPGRNMDDSDSMALYSSCASNKVDPDGTGSPDQDRRTSNLHRVRGLNRPNVWITPIKAEASQRQWKVKRVWDVEVVDDEEVEHCVDHENLMDKIRLLFGVPQHFGKIPEELDIDKVAKPWYIKRVFDIEGEIDSSDDDESELVLSNSVMVDIMERIFDSEGFVFQKARITTLHKLALHSKECSTSTSNELNFVQPSDSEFIHKLANSVGERVHDDVVGSAESTDDGDGACQEQDRLMHEKQKQATVATRPDTRRLPHSKRRLERTSTTAQEYTVDDNPMDTIDVTATERCCNTPMRYDGEFLESGINQRLQNDCRPPFGQALYRRHSTGDMPRKEPERPSPTKEVGSNLEATSSLLNGNNDDSRHAAKSRMPEKYATKGRCLSLHGVSSPVKANR